MRRKGAYENRLFSFGINREGAGQLYPSRTANKAVNILYAEFDIKANKEDGGMNEIWVALIAFAGTAIGTAGGIITSSKLTNYRLQQLEKKVDKHNSLVERMYKIEGCIEKIDEKIKVTNHRIKDLEDIQKIKEEN